MRTVRTRRFANQLGTSTLEFIVVLPTLLVVLFGIVELSRAWFTLNLATTAAREAARAGAVAAPSAFPDPPTAMQRMNDILGPGTWGTVTCSANPCAPDAQVTATVTVTFQTIWPVILPSLQTMTITQTGRARYE